MLAKLQASGLKVTITFPISKLASETMPQPLLLKEPVIRVNE
jgi:hypothetical protein